MFQNTFPIPVKLTKIDQVIGNTRLTDIVVGWREIGGATYFFNGKDNAAGRWLHL